MERWLLPLRTVRTLRRPPATSALEESPDMHDMNREVIITCAVTGGGARPKNPNVPITPQQIAASAIEAAKEGAAIVHCHVRDPETGVGTWNVDLFREVVDRVQSSGTDVVLNLTGGGLALIYIDDDNPLKLRPESSLATPRVRLEHVEKLLPEIMSLDMGSFSSDDDNGIYAGHASAMRAMAKRLKEIKVKPEIEAFDVSAIIMARRLYKDGLFEDPPMFQFCLGVGLMAPATLPVLLAMRDLLPSRAQWAAFSLGRHQLPMAAQSVLLGGHVRVGLEDNLYLKKGVYATNASLVERAREVVQRLGASVLTPAQARERLNLVKRNY